MTDIYKLKKKEYKKLMSTYGKLILMCNGQGPYTIVRQNAEKEMSSIRASILRHHGRYELESSVNSRVHPSATNIARFQVYYRNWKNEQLVKLGLATAKIAA